jgi:hypothetical protein
LPAGSRFLDASVGGLLVFTPALAASVGVLQPPATSAFLPDTFVVSFRACGVVESCGVLLDVAGLVGFTRVVLGLLSCPDGLGYRASGSCVLG